jgi:hypothetical protein
MRVFGFRGSPDGKVFVRATKAAQNRATNPAFGELEPLSDRLTRERLIPLDGGLEVACKDGHARAEHLHTVVTYYLACAASPA